MEKAIHELYGQMAESDKRMQFDQVHQYPIDGKPPMMLHIFTNRLEKIIIAAKGAPEAILQQSTLSFEELQHIKEQTQFSAKSGYRVLGVGKGTWEELSWP